MPLQANHGNREGFAHIVVINQRSDCGRIPVMHNSKLPLSMDHNMTCTATLNKQTKDTVRPIIYVKELIFNMQAEKVNS